MFDDHPTVPVPERVLGVVSNPDRIAAGKLANRLQGLSAARAQLDHKFPILLAEFDSSDAWRWFDGIGSTAHWLSWSCSIAPGTTREYVRVARALRKLPEVANLMGEGRLTYSKVRELSRLVPPPAPTPPTSEPASAQTPPTSEPASESETLPFDEHRLCALALEMTASQLARTVRAYRHLPGKRIQAEAQRGLTWRTRDDGLCELRVLLPADEAATIRAAIETAQSAQKADDVAAGTSEPDQATEPDQVTPNLPVQPMVDGLLEVASVYLATDQRDTSDDHRVVTVLVGAETLAVADSVPAGTPTHHHPSSTADRCELAGGEGLEAETARRLGYCSRVIGAVVDDQGEVLHFGRTRRRVSKAQRRALGIRDGHCQFPECARRRWLQAHHIEHWIDGGPTDLVNLILLCHFHHKAVHEGGIVIHREGPRWAFLLPDGSHCRQSPPLNDEQLLERLTHWAAAQARRPDPERVFPPHGGVGFQLADCVGEVIAGDVA